MTREEFINIYCLPRYNTDGSLIKIIIEDSGIKRIPPYIFYDCKLLESITIPDSIIAIGNHAFAGCESLSNIILPNKLIRIEDHDMLNWLKANRKLMNAGTLKPERVAPYTQLLWQIEKYKNKNQYE